MQNAKNIIF